KIAVFMFAPNFAIIEMSLTYVCDCKSLNAFAQSRTIATRNMMTNCCCAVCGTLVYRVGSGFPGMSGLRIANVNHFQLHETNLKPKMS
ncbi:hypothetical protein K438DRAFT_1569543, partial [Mycena galopus ATCC 62051]